MSPININNFNFNTNTYSNIFKPLLKINPSDYKFIMDIVTIGADIKRNTTPPPISNKNYPIHDHKLILKVTEKLLKHLKSGHFRGPYALDELPILFDTIHTSPIAAKFKSSGKVMILVDASAPKSHNINSEIPQHFKSTKYSSFDDLCYLLIRIGPYGWIWVVDAVDAYYRIPIHKKFQHLFGINWLGKILIYKCLSFGLSTAPSIYNRFADLLVWACTYYKRKEFLDKNYNIFNILHYLDDFYGGHKNKKVCLNQMNFLIKLMKDLNIPTNDKKVVGPTQCADILGWTCKTVPVLQIGLKESKRVKYSNFIKSILNNNYALTKQFEIVDGYLRHFIKIFPIGNKFIRNLEKQKYTNLNLIKKGKINNYFKITLSSGTIFELNLWFYILTDSKFKFTELSFITNFNNLPIINVWTDASTSFGAGGYSSTNNIFHLPWESLKILPKNKFLSRFSVNVFDHIIYLELLALVSMSLLFAKNWKNFHVNFYCDNTAVVSAINKGSLKFDSKLYYPKANLIILFARIALKYQFTFTAIPIDGDDNTIADTLSRNNEFKRNLIYNYLKLNQFIPNIQISNLINCTCVDRFSLFHKF